MAHPEINNDSPYVYDSLHSNDENGDAILVAIVKATFAIDKTSQLVLADEQADITYTGETWQGNDNGAYIYEPETAFIKPTSDIVLVGHAHAPKRGATKVEVSLNVGAYEKTVRVFGDRKWGKLFGIVTISSAQPFEKIPLVYEKAFGGWDRNDPDAHKHKFEPRNPVGTGYHGRHHLQEGMPLPNLEDPYDLIKKYSDKPAPAGFGFISPNWQPRVKYAGTYNAKWQEERMPLLPLNFDRRFFNAASPGLITSGYLRGDEQVVIKNASTKGTLAFKLPGVPPPVVNVALRGFKKHTLTTNLDTVIINTDEDKVFLIWRHYLHVRNGPQDVVSIGITDGVTGKGATVYKEPDALVADSEKTVIRQAPPVGDDEGDTVVLRKPPPKQS